MPSLAEPRTAIKRARETLVRSYGMASSLDSSGLDQAYDGGGRMTDEDNGARAGTGCSGTTSGLRLFVMM